MATASEWPACVSVRWCPFCHVISIRSPWYELCPTCDGVPREPGTIITGAAGSFGPVLTTAAGAFTFGPAAARLAARVAAALRAVMIGFGICGPCVIRFHVTAPLVTNPVTLFCMWCDDWRTFATRSAAFDAPWRACSIFDDICGPVLAEIPFDTITCVFLACLWFHA